MTEQQEIDKHSTSTSKNIWGVLSLILWGSIFSLLMTGIIEDYREDSYLLRLPFVQVLAISLIIITGFLSMASIWLLFRKPDKVKESSPRTSNLTGDATSHPSSVVLAILFCCIAMGGVLSGLVFEGSVASPGATKNFLEGFLICLGGFIIAGLPIHYYLKKKEKTTLRDYSCAGLIGGFSSGVLIAPIMMGLHALTKYKSSFGYVEISNASDVFRGMLALGIFGLIGGGFCSVTFWYTVISRKITFISGLVLIAMVQLFFMGAITIILAACRLFN